MLVVRLPAQGEAPARTAGPSQVHKAEKTHTEKNLTCEPPPDIHLPAYARVSHEVELDLGRVYLATRQARRIAVVCGMC